MCIKKTKYMVQIQLLYIEGQGRKSRTLFREENKLGDQILAVSCLASHLTY